MNYNDTSLIEKIIEHQFILILQEKGIKIDDLSTLEKLNYRYNIALQLLIEIGVKNEK